MPANPEQSPVIQTGPIINAEAAASPIIMEENTGYDPNQDFSCGCTAIVPAGSRALFMKFCLIVMAVGAIVMYGFFKLSESLGWM
ncbi:MAG: hypothetical protein NC211_04990 [Alistipes senegalensis]|nr:hypothetical protein [Oxalobacter formigenes]MCM1281172.1 hypothetical protein [Alistipes senegalensis]